MTRHATHCDSNIVPNSTNQSKLDAAPHTTPRHTDIPQTEMAWEHLRFQVAATPIVPPKAVNVASQGTSHACHVVIFGTKIAPAALAYVERNLENQHTIFDSEAINLTIDTSNKSCSFLRVFFPVAPAARLRLPAMLICRRSCRIRMAKLQCLCSTLTLALVSRTEVLQLHKLWTMKRQ